MPRKVTFQVDADTTKAQKGIKDTGTSLSGLQGVLSKFGAPGKAVSDLLGSIGLNGLGAGAALGGATAFAKSAVESYIALGDKIRTYSLVTGESADASSRQVQAFGELGVSAEDAEKAMAKLARTVAVHNNALTKLGIQTAYDSTGNVDLSATLDNVINAYQATSDAAERAQIVFAAFGKGGQALIPVLETNSAQLKKLEAQVKMVYTDADLEKVRQYKIEQASLGQEWDDFKNGIGQALTGPLVDLMRNTREQTYVSQQLDKAYHDGKISYQDYTDAINAGSDSNNRLVAGFQKQWLAAENAKSGIDQLTASQKQAAQAALDEAQAEQVATDALNKRVDAGYAYRQSVLDLTKAKKDAKDANYKDAEANLRLEEALKNVADAAVALKEKQAEANGTTLNAQQQTQIYIDTLTGLLKGIDRKSPTYKALTDLINQYKELAAAEQQAAAHSLNPNRGAAPSKGGVAIGSFAEGGTVPGPTGQAQLAIVHGGETVTPVGGSNSGGGGDVHYHIGNLIASPGSWDWLANQLLMHARRRPGT